MARGSMRIVRGSWAVLRKDPELLCIPVLTFFILTSFTVAWIASGFLAGPLAVVLACLPLTFVVTFVTLMGNAAIVAAATARMEGEDPSLRDAWRMAWAIRMKIVRWSLYTVFVRGLIHLSQTGLASLLGRFGEILGYAAHIAWSVATYFVIPVLLFERVTTADAGVARSKQIARGRWGEQVTGRVRIVGVTHLFAAVMAVAGLVIILTELPYTMLIGVGVWIVGVPAPIVLGATMSSVLNAALYRYAISGAVPPEYRGVELHTAVKVAA